MENKYFYIGKEQALRNESFVYCVSDERIYNFNDIFGENCIEYVGQNLPHYITLEESGIVREATNIELYKRGIYKIRDDEFIKDDVIYSIYDYYIDEGMIRPIFNIDKCTWEESATLEEKSIFWRERCKLISSEIMILERAGLEGDFEYITLQEDLNISKNNYMTASRELALEMDKLTV